VECHRILDEPYVVVMPADHRLADADAVEVSALKGERLLGRPPDCPPWGPDLRHACRIEGFEPRLEPLYTSSTFRDVQAFVAAGRGLSMLPALALPSARSDLVAPPLSPGLVRHVTVAVAADGSCSPGVVAMVEALHESARSLHPDLIAAAG
jgi:DNA-binding transcriptional LysR family regulator